MSKKKNTIDTIMDDNVNQTPISSEPIEDDNIIGTQDADVSSISALSSENEKQFEIKKKDTYLTAEDNIQDDINDKSSVHNLMNDTTSNEVLPDTIVSEDKIENNGITVNNSLDVNDTSENGQVNNSKPKKKITIFAVLRIACAIGFVIFTYLFINEVFIEPYRANKAVELTRDLLIKPSNNPTQIPTQIPSATPVGEATPTPDPNRDDKGRLLTFQKLLRENEDTKGWVTIPDTNIDYVVMQNSVDPVYYLTRDFNKENQKAGCLFLDYKSSVENNTQNIVIHGHNMTSTDNMFHYLCKYKELDWYKKRPVFDFNSIYQTGKWKIFSVFITNGTSKKEPLFDYTQSTFKDSAEFLNFIYKLRIRSLYNMDTVDVNENDQIVTLSTCSYEVKNYRTVVVARRVRDGEDLNVDVDSVTVNPEPLYPSSWYYRYSGKAPKFADTFEEALKNGDIKWYTPPIVGETE